MPRTRMRPPQASFFDDTQNNITVERLLHHVSIESVPPRPAQCRRHGAASCFLPVFGHLSKAFALAAAALFRSYIDMFFSYYRKKFITDDVRNGGQDTPARRALLLPARWMPFAAAAVSVRNRSGSPSTSLNVTRATSVWHQNGFPTHKIS